MKPIADVVRLTSAQHPQWVVVEACLRGASTTTHLHNENCWEVGKEAIARSTDEIELESISLV